MKKVYVFDTCSVIALLTNDHHELGIVEEKENLDVIWIRKRRKK
jgi:hypothetical protein